MLNTNIEVTKDSKLIITCNLAGKGMVSKSKKSETICSSQGNQPIGSGGMSIGLNVYRARELTPAVIKEIEEAALLQAQKAKLKAL